MDDGLWFHTKPWWAMWIIAPTLTIALPVILYLISAYNTDESSFFNIIFMVVLFIGSSMIIIFSIYLMFVPFHSYYIGRDFFIIRGGRIITELKINIDQIKYFGYRSEIIDFSCKELPDIDPKKNRKLTYYTDERGKNHLLIVTKMDDMPYFIWISPVKKVDFIKTMESTIEDKAIINNDILLMDILKRNELSIQEQN